MIGVVMTDEEQARSALAEVARRRGEATRIAGRQAMPRWYLVAGAAVLVALAVQTDLRELNSGWDGWFARWGLLTICLAVVLVAAVVAYRRSVVSVHRSAFGERIGAVVAVVVPFYFCMMAIGMPMRLYRIPFDQTVSLVGAGLLVGAGWLVWRRVRARRA